MLCVRLVFCLYAEDAGIFSSNKKMFHDYLQKFDAPDIRKALIELFKILDTKPEDRDPYDTSDVAVAWTGQQLYQQRGEQENASFYAVLLLYL